jgi:hypothetical protein
MTNAARRCLLLAILVTLASVSPAAQQKKPLFTFHSNAWLNLHHYARIVARNNSAPKILAADDQKQWDASVEFYKPYAARDVLRDDGMVAIKTALRRAEGKPSLDGIAIDAGLKATLERMMPIYQKQWWAGHDRANREWIATMQPLVDRHGPALSQSLARVYGVSWPSEPIPVDLVATAGPDGAYGTNSPDAHITMAPAQFQGNVALEILLHESTHGIVPLFQMVSEAASKQNVKVPPQLSHAVLFYTAGELTARELKAHGVDYKPYPDAQFLERMYGAGCRDKIVQHWGPRLDGKRSIPDALFTLVAAFR